MRYSIPVIDSVGGFTLPSVLIALALFSVMATTLSGYSCGIQKRIEEHAQIRQLWHYALEQLEDEAPALPVDWPMAKQRTDDAFCHRITVRIDHPMGYTAMLTRHHCLLSE